MTAPLTMEATAAELGLSWERFRKVWRDHVKRLGFPAPLNEGGRPRWDADAVAAWKAERSRRRLAGEPEARPTPEPASAVVVDLNASRRKGLAQLAALRAAS